MVAEALLLPSEGRCSRKPICLIPARKNCMKPFLFIRAHFYIGNFSFHGYSSQAVLKRTSGNETDLYGSSVSRHRDEVSGRGYAYCSSFLKVNVWASRTKSCFFSASIAV